MKTNTEKSHAWPRLNIYRAGRYGYAFNPTSRQWEVYALSESGEIEDLICERHSKDAAWSEVASLNARRTEVSA